MDFITHLPTSEGFDSVFTIIDGFPKYVTFIPCKAICTAPDLARIFYDQFFCNFGMPQKIVSDRDRIFFVQILVGPHVPLTVYFGNVKWLSPLDRWLVGSVPLFC